MAAACTPAAFNPFNLPAAFAPEGSSFEANVAAACAYASALVAFLREHGWVLEAHPVQLLTRRPLRRLPPAWLDELNAADAAAWLAPPPGAAPQPGSLAAWFARAAALAMPREAVHEGCAPLWQGVGEGVAKAPKACVRLEELHTSAKKAHELSRFAACVAALAQRSGCGRVVDAGAGCGRLGGALAARYALRVTGLERDADAVQRAARRRAWLDADAQRRGADANTDDAGCVTLQADVDARAADCVALPPGERAVLTGLHACGELTVDVLRLFCSQPDTYAAVAVAGCCYQHASSFPVSAACAAAAGSAADAAALLPRRAREAAAQSAGADFLCRQPPPRRAALRKRALARALLELLHAERCEASDAAELSGKHPYDLKTPFSAYAAAALAIPGGCSAADAAALDARYAAVVAEEDAGLAALTAMRCAAGAVAEALLVLDRALLLAETLPADDVAMGVTPLFDPGVSPRNLVVWARRLR